MVRKLAMMVASPGTIMVAKTSTNSNLRPRKRRKEKAKAAMEQVIICPSITAVETIKEFSTNRGMGFLNSASLKFCRLISEGISRLE